MYLVTANKAWSRDWHNFEAAKGRWKQFNAVDALAGTFSIIISPSLFMPHRNLSDHTTPIIFFCLRI